MEHYRIVLLIGVVSAIVLQIDIVNVVSVYKYDKDALKRQYNIQKCKETVT